MSQGCCIRFHNTIEDGRFSLLCSVPNIAAVVNQRFFSLRVALKIANLGV